MVGILQPIAKRHRSVRPQASLNSSRSAKPKTGANMPPLLHGATLRCMRERLDDHGFDPEAIRGFAPVLVAGP